MVGSGGMEHTTLRSIRFRPRRACYIKGPSSRCVPVGAAAWRTMLTMGRRKSQKGSTANDPRQTEVSRAFLLSSFIINLTWMQRNLRPGRREFRRGNVGRLLPPDSIGRTQDVSMMTQIPLIPSG